MDKIDADIKKWIEGEPGVHEIGPITSKEFLRRIADSGMPGALFAKFCLENPDVQIGKRIVLDAEE